MKHGLCLCRSLCFYIKHNVRTSISLLDERTVCSASIKELTLAVKSTDKSQTVKIGGHRLDPQGNYNAPKTIPLSQSEIYLSELIDSICNKMEDYARGIWKSNGTLTILKMVVDGKMNPHMDDIDFVQDEDLNKSLKYYCESVMEEYEEDIIKHYQNGENLDEKYCTENSNICLPHKPDILKNEL
ncbi:protein seele isoform X2 [Sitophilus oryzae]|uniref:Protein seele isoform X2 n=1 Tax=Sitophilus oryzae TaxID=7048 RepID=A0A6J2YME7_SITOR|nr:protein seele isoform X2 [Sitophilus oryzae]